MKITIHYRTFSQFFTGLTWHPSKLFVNSGLVVGCLVFLVATSQGQVVWNGGVSADWSEPTNWVGGVVPGVNDEVVVPATANQPVIALATSAAAHSVSVQSGATLTVNGDLTVVDSPANGISIAGTLTNAGQITVNNATEFGLFVTTSDGVFSNSGTALLLNGTNGLHNNGVVNNAGLIQVDSTFDNAVVNVGTFNNVVVNCTLEIHKVIDFKGLSNFGTLSNQGYILIDSTHEQGIVNLGAAEFTNAASGHIQISAAGTLDSPHQGITNSADFTNQGEITVLSSSSTNINNSNIFLNSGILTVAATNPGTMGLSNSGIFSNTGTINITVNGGSVGVFQEGEIFDNFNVLTINGLGSTSNGIQNQDSLVNHPNGVITIINAGEHGLRNTTSNAHLVNHGSIVINSTGTGSPNGHGIFNERIFSNFGHVSIRKTKQYGIQNNSGQLFEHGLLGGSAILTIDSTGEWYAGINNQGTFSGPDSLVLTNTHNIGILNTGNFTAYGSLQVANPTYFGIYTSNTFANYAVVTVANCGQQGIYLTGANSSFQNSAAVTVMNTGNNGVYLENGQFTNLLPTSSLTVVNCTSHGLALGSPTAGFTNFGEVLIGSQTVTGDGVWSLDGAVTNHGEFTLGQGIAGSALNCPFSNTASGLLKGKGNIVGNFTNAGTISPGYSPGVFTFLQDFALGGGEFLAEVDGLAGLGQVGGNDALVVNDTITLNGNLTLDVNFQPVNGDLVLLIEADTLIGTIVTFTAPPGWNLQYNYPSTGQLSAGYGGIPVELVRFGAELLPNGQVGLNWETASELNLHYFGVERSSNGISFEQVGKIVATEQGAKGSIYGLTDEKPMPGQSYYRLRMVDLDGSEAFSNLAGIFIEKQAKDPFVVFPNPTNGFVTVHWPEQDVLENLALTNMTGQTLAVWNKESLVQPIDLQGVPPGVYMLVFNTGNAVLAKKLVLK